MAESGDQETKEVLSTPAPEQRRGLFGWLRRDKPPEPQPDITRKAIEEPMPTPTLEEPEPEITTAQEVKTREPKQTLTIPSEKVESLIKEKNKGDPAKEAGLLTSARILRPMLEDSSRLGLSEDEQKAVRKYAKSAGEKVSKEIKESASTNPLERVDQIFHDIVGKVHEYNQYGDLQRVTLSLQYKGFRDNIQRILNEVATEQQQRDFDDKPSSFDEVCKDYLEKDLQINPNSVIGVQGAMLMATLDPASAEQVLKGLGVLGSNHSLKNLQASEKWSKYKEPGLYGRIGGTLEYSPIVEASALKPLDSEVPGVKVVVYERENLHYNIKQQEFEIRLVFSPEVLTEALKSPLAQAEQSLFYRQPLNQH